MCCSCVANVLLMCVGFDSCVLLSGSPTALSVLPCSAALCHTRTHHIYIHTYTYIHTYICIYINTHIHTHTHIICTCIIYIYSGAHTRTYVPHLSAPVFRTRSFGTYICFLHIYCYTNYYTLYFRHGVSALVLQTRIFSARFVRLPPPVRSGK
jgi:hypothetical protein